MTWEVCIQYANGNEQPLYQYRQREAALRCIDQLYIRQGYPLHFAYIVRQGEALGLLGSA